MTLQTKRFIELSDILALRFECRHCGATLTIDARKSFSVPPRECVNCKNDLWGYEDATVDQAIRKLADDLKLLERVMDGDKRVAFSFSLEIKEDTKKNVS
jgi:Zn ribbon nucleic-acid-binding protein